MKAKEKRKQESKLVGKFFHTFENDKLCYQGEIISEEAPGLFLVQLFDWIMGFESIQKLVSIEDMKGWVFYPDKETMAYNAEKYE